MMDYMETECLAEHPAGATQWTGIKTRLGLGPESPSSNFPCEVIL